MVNYWETRSSQSHNYPYQCTNVMKMDSFSSVMQKPEWSNKCSIALIGYQAALSRRPTRQCVFHFSKWIFHLQGEKHWLHGKICVFWLRTTTQQHCEWPTPKITPWQMAICILLSNRAFYFRSFSNDSELSNSWFSIGQREGMCWNHAFLIT